jgi:membrane fusion protein, multidrug efflux system
MKPDSTKKKIGVYIPLVIVIIIVLAGAWYWYRDYSMYITTDDAHVDADNVSVGAKIMGRIAAIYTDEGEIVKKGQLLADIDSSDLVAQRNQSIAIRNQSLTSLSQAQIKYNSDQKGIKVLEINLERASEDLARAKSQSDGGVITPEAYDHAKKTFETAQAQLDAAKAQLEVSKSLI